MKLRTKIAGLLLLCVAFDSAALTLGRIRGSAVLGQSLDIAVQIQTDSGEDIAAQCFEADVFHADARQSASQVRLVVQKMAQPLMAEVRVMSLALVDEPVVMLHLRYGCGQLISRLYVLLADLPQPAIALSGSPAGSSAFPAPALIEPDLTPSTAVSARLPPPALAQSAAAPALPAKGRTLVTPKPVAKKPARSPRSAMNREVAPSKRLATDNKDKPGRTVSLSRLKLDPLEMLSDRIANLDSTMTFAPSEDALLNLQKMKTLEGEVKALRDSAAKNERSLADLKVRLQQAEVQRFPAAVIYALAALLIVCLLAVAWFWSRQRRSSGAGDLWWSDASPKQAPLGTEHPGAANPIATALRQSPDQAHESRGRHAGAADAGHSSGLEAHSIHLSDSAFSDFRQSSAAEGEHPDRALQPKGAERAPVKLVRSLNSDAVLDIRRQAEKLVSLGMPERARDILKRQVHESDEPNPLVYLDLLTLFHELNMKSEYQQSCQDFSLLFNGKVPDFDLFGDEGQGLESYPEALRSITAAWSTPKVLELIEACIYRDPWVARSEPFDLAAMRELLLLHGMAQSVFLAGVSSDDDSGSNHSQASDAPASQPSQLDYADSVASSFPALSKSALADLFGPEKELPQILDLDLSALAGHATSAQIVPPADIDLSRQRR